MTTGPDREPIATSDARRREHVAERLAHLVVSRNHITADTLEELQHRAKWLNESLLALIRKERLVDEGALVDLLSEITGIPVVSIADTGVETEALDLVPPRVASEYSVIPVRRVGNTLTLATERVYDVQEEDHLRILLDHSIEWALCKSHEVSECLKYYYGVGIQAFIASGSDGTLTAADATERPEHEENSAITAFVRQVIHDAIRTNATDVHFEPYEGRFRLRYRIDGVLYPISLPRGIERHQRAIVSSIKVMAQLDIAERRQPQDGAFTADFDEQSYDIRVSVLPSLYGEAANLRILNRTTTFLTLRELGLREDQFELMKRIMSNPNGVVLFTGATGSGKTTSLYASIAWLNDTERKIITIEDPIEYHIQGVTQLQVHPAIGFTFANGLRSVLRHDPDVILIGEIRDSETANIAISSAMTGHLVFSTLHTNDSASALPRLIDMGVEPYLVSSSVQAIIAQRLVRQVCESCKEQTPVDPHVLNEIRSEFPDAPRQPTFYRGRGCPDCRFTGYAGRQAVFEILAMDDDLRALVAERVPSSYIMKSAIDKGMTTLRHGGWACALEGRTTIDDVLRVTRRE